MVYTSAVQVLAVGRAADSITHSPSQDRRVRAQGNGSWWRTPRSTRGSASGIRCYAGIPLVSSRGHVLGTLCVLGTQSRSFTAGELEVLRELAGRAVERIEQRRR